MERSPKGRGKLKKRGNSNVSKTKKPNAKRQKDGPHVNPQSKANKENRRPVTAAAAAAVVGLHKSLYPPSLSNVASTSRLGGLRPSKAKISETVTARKVLGSLQVNTADSCPSSSTSKDLLQIDLRRVLGKPSESVHSASGDTATAATALSVKPHPQTPPSPSQPATMDPFAATANGSSGTVEMSPDGGSGPTSTANSAVPAVPVAEIGQHIIEGLQVDVIFPDSTYLHDIKAELRKVFKQCNPCSYEELMSYFSRSSVTSNSPHPTPPPAPPLPPPPALFGHTFMDPISSSIDVLNQPLPPSDGHMMGHVSDLVALNLEVNTSALNINDRITPEEGDNSAPIAPGNTHDLRPRDFLDLLDTTPSAGSHHTHQAHASSPALSSPLCWSNTPSSRPRLFPHKLY